MKKATLSAALALAIASTGILHAQLFVANGVSGTIGEYGLDGSTVNTALISGLGGDPSGFAISGGNFFIANYANNTIGEYGLDGSTINASLITGLSTPTGLAISGSNLFVANLGNGTIGEYGLDGSIINASLITGLSEPEGIAISGGHLYVANLSAGTIGEYGLDGSTINASLITGLSVPVGLAISGTNLFVANQADGGYIGEYGLDGSTVNAALVSGLGNAGGIAVSGGDIFVTVYVANTIGEYRLDGSTVNASLISGLDGPNFIFIPATPALTNIAWVNPAGGDWNNTNNWSLQRVPGSGDNVIITQSGTYTVTNSSSATIGSLTLGSTNGTQTLDISSLTLNNAGTVNSNGVLNWSGGDLEGSLTVAQGGTLTISNTVNFAYNNYGYDLTNMNTATLTNYGTVIAAGNLTGYGDYPYGGGGGLVYNAGLWEAVTDGSVTVGFTGTNTFVNAGTLEKIGGTGTSTINWNFDNEGGTVTTLSGSFSMGNWSGNGLIVGNATYSSGTISGTLVPGAVINISGATINSSLIVSSNAVLNWSGGDLEGSLTVAQGGTLTISNTVNFAYNNYGYDLTNMNTATLTNYGTVIAAGNLTGYGDYPYGGGGGLVYNAGLWEAVTDGSVTVGFTGTNTFVNAGTLEKIGGTGTSTINWNFDNEGGTVTTLSGSFSMGNWSGNGLIVGNATYSSGTISGTLVPGAVINISGATINSSLIVSSNAVLNWSGGDLEGSLTVAQGGTLTISNTVVFAYNNYPYGYTNTATLTNYGTVIWAGTIYGEGNYNGGGGGLIDNAGLWESVADNAMSPTYEYSSTNSLFINTGTLEKIGGTGTSTINWNFENNGGTVTTMSGAFSMGNWTGNGLVIGNATYSSGTISGTLVRGAVINISGATINSSLIVSSSAVLNWSGGDLEGALTVAQGGTLTISNTVVFAYNNYPYGYTNTATLTNYGTVISAGTIYSEGNSQGGGGGLIDNAGLWESVADNAMSPTYEYTSTNSLFINTGTLEKIGGTGATTIGWNFDSQDGVMETSVGFFTFSGNWVGNGLMQGNATISGTLGSTVASNAVINWIGGDLEGALTVAQGGTLTISNTIVFAQNNYSYGYTNTATLTNYGTVIWGAGTIYGAANSSGGGGGLIDNAGLWESVADDTMSITYAYISTNSLFINTGTLEKIGGTGATTIGWNFDSQDGVLETSVGFFTFLGNWVGNGLMQGNAVVSGNIGGIVASNAVLNWSGGDLEGALTVAQGGTLTISNTVVFAQNNYNYGYTNTATLTNYGTVIWGAGTIYGVANSSGGGGGLIDNAGLWESVADNTMSITYAYPSTNSLFLNTGTLEKIGGTGPSTINWNLNNTGTVLAVDGTIGFDGGFNLTNGLLDFAISGPSTFGQISVSGTANLAGGIGAILLNGYVPSVGTRFNVMTFSSNTGAFTNYSGLNPGGGIVFNPTVSATTVTLQAAATNYFGVTPFIVTQPTGQTVNYNGTVTMNVVVSGSSPLTFQWKQNGMPVPGGTNATLTLTNVLVSQAGAYTVFITNSAGGAVSQPVTLTVVPAVPVITWSSPAGINYGTALSTNQLNASANVPGTFVYSPPVGTVLSAGGNTLFVTFTPNDAVDYVNVNSYASISVSQIPLTVRANSASRVYDQTNPVFTGTITGLTNGDTITATYSCSAVPISPPGAYPIVPTLIDPNGRSGNYSITLSNGSLTVTPGAPPTFISIVPNTGITNGGTSVTLTGSGFELGAGVAFGSQPATSVMVNGDGSQITAITPSGSLGTVSVLITNPDATMVTLTNGFTYTTPPDLAPVSVATSVSGNSGGSIQVVCVVTNEGGGSASGVWADGIYFSSNALPNIGTAELLNYVVLNHNVAAGGSYAWTNSVTLPEVTQGTYYLFVVANDTSSGYPAIIEVTKTNNTSAAKLLQVDSPDLAVGGIAAPASALIGQTVQVTFTITNAGSGPATGPWVNEILLANDTNGTGAQSLGTFGFDDVIPAGASTNLTQTVILPSGITGTRYFGVVVDSGNTLPDPDRTNNTSFAVASTLITGPDLAMAQLNVPGTAQFGQSFNVSFTVTNVGGAAATAAWNDQIYLSTQSNSLVGATVLATLAGSSPLAAGSGYTRTQAVTIPLTGASTPGNFYIIAVADSGNAILEVTKANNQLASPIALTLPPLPELAVGQVGSPATATAGQAISVSWTVTNIGSATATGSWQEAVYLAPASLTLQQFTTNLTGYPLLGTFTFTNNLSIGQSVTRTEQVTIPLTGLAGDLRAAVFVDSDGGLLEQNGSNNIALATNDLEVPVTLSLVVPVTNVLENTSTPNFTCMVSRNGDLSAALFVALGSTATNNLMVPAGVTIPAGVSSSPFTATVLDDGVPGPNVAVTLSASAAGYVSATSQVTVVNTDLPGLALSAPSQITEGQSVTVTLTSTTTSGQPVVVSIGSSSSTALSVPAAVTIPAKTNSVTFTALAVQNSIIAPTQTYTISASAGGYTGASTSLSVINDNTPTLTLSLDHTNINEADGFFAAIATVSRQPITGQPLTVALTSTNTGAAIVPAQVTIPALLGNATFYVAAVNDTNVTGPKFTLISAQGLDVQGNPVGSPATGELVVQDNNGPVLRVSLANAVVPKGTNPATTGVVWTTTPPTNTLLVTLASSETNEATVPATVTIPAGQTNAMFSVASIDDGVPFTSQTLSITASATNYASGSGVLTVTDSGLPDLVIASITAPGSAFPTEPITISFRVLNQGLGALTNGITQNVYLSTNPLSDNYLLLGSASIAGPLAPGQYVDQSVVVSGSALPMPGTYWVVVTADADNNAVELNEANNSAVSGGPLVVSPNYTATVKAGLTNVLMGTSVPLTGSATLTGGGPAANAPVNILVTVRGFQRIIGVVTDANGNFSAVFTPLSNEVGTYTVSAVFPGIVNAPAQDQFNILGMSLNPPSLSLSLGAGGSVAGTASLQNLTDVPLTGLSISVNGLAANLSTSPTLNSNYLAGQGTLTLSFTLTASDASIQQSSFTIQITSAEGAIIDLPVSVTVNPLVPRLVTTPAQISTAMLVGGQTMVQFSVFNTGGAPTGPLVVSLPPLTWFNTASVNPLPSLAPGQSNVVSLLLTPPTNFTLGAYTGVLAVNGSGVGAQVPFTFNAVSDEHGTLLIQSVDELTFFAAGAPPLTNATVTLTDPTSGSVVASGVTGTNGLFAVSNILAGTYNLAMTASQHSAFNGFAIVTAGQTNNVQAFLSLQTVSYTWTVVPTQIQDQTEITIQAIFQTDVPAPVIVPTPTSLDLSTLTQSGQIMDVPLTLANEGLIGVTNVTLTVGSSDLYQFDIVTTNIGSLPAHGTVTIPMRITMLTNAANNASAAKAASKSAIRMGQAVSLATGGGSCSPTVGVDFSYQCGPYGVNSSVQLPVQNAQTDCGTPPIIEGFISVSVSTGPGGGGGNGPGGGGGGGDGPGGGGGGGDNGGTDGGPSITLPSIGVPTSCDPCLEKQLHAAGDCLLGLVAFPSKALNCAKNGYLCGKGLAESCINAKEPGAGCGLAATGCLHDLAECSGPAAEALLEKVPWVGQAIALVSCTYSMVTACDEESSILAAKPRNLSLQSALSSDVGAQTFVNLMASEANDVQTVINPDLYFFGSSVWFNVTDTNTLQTLFNQFANDIETNSDGGQFITANERTALLALPLPSPLAASDLNAFLDRWNLTMSNYAAGILTIGQLSAGGDTNFIDFQQWTTMTSNELQVIQTYNNEGYTDPVSAWLATRAALFNEVQGGPVGTCAQITLQIDQTAVLTENAFHATLQMNNNGTVELTNVLVSIVVQNQSGQDVTSLFGIQSPVLTGGLTAVDGTGLLAPSASGTAQWTLLPGLDAAPLVPTNYFVSGTISYIENGIAVSIPLSPQSITVQPSPQLYLRYFLQRDVYGDDPFTPQIEPSIPFPLAVMVQNQGYGTAYNFQITSAQPQIVDNQKGLIINFDIIGTELEGQPVSPSLTVNFGNIAPGAIEMGEWLFTSSLEGLFTDYSATYKDLDNLGNPMLSPIQGVEIHEITHMVEADGAWDDGQPDFLVINPLDPNSLPNLLYMSDWSIQPVSVVQTATNSGPVTSGNLQIQISANFPAGFSYVLVPDPANGQFPLQNVLYANGTNFLTNNFWITDRTFIGLSEPPLLQTNLHLFVYHTNAGPDTFTLVYTNASSVTNTNAPVSSVFALPSQSPPTFGVVWSGASDLGAAPLAYFDIYSSDDGGPFVVWQSQTTNTGAIFNGASGHTYSFYSVATDVAGHREATPLQPEAQTTVGVNTNPPTISVVSNVTLNAGQTLSLSVTASDPNPQNTLSFSLGSGAPVGAVVNSTSGQITWATSPLFGGTTNTIKVIATDNGQPALSATGVVQVVVIQVTNPPVLAPIPNYTINEASLLTFTSSATDNNLPPKPLTFSLGAGAPTNATIDPVTGLFQWQPTAAQAPSTNIISVVVTDNGTPPLSATQQFTVVVNSVVNEFLLGFGSTNLLTGGTNFVPVTLDSSLSLTNITAILSASTNSLANLTLVPVSPEITSTVLQYVGSNQYSLSLGLNPALSPGNSRTLAQLTFAAVPQQRSAIVRLVVTQPAALQTGGQTAAKPGAANGQVIVVGKEPVLAAGFGTNGNSLLTLYGNPGASYAVAYSTNLAKTNWLLGWRVPMTNLYETFVPNTTLPHVFYQAWEFSANPPILQLNQSVPTNLGLLIYGQMGSNYIVSTGSNLSNLTNWTPVADFTLTNSFQFLNVGNPTNPVQFFKVQSP